MDDTDKATPAANGTPTSTPVSPAQPTANPVTPPVPASPAPVVAAAPAQKPFSESIAVVPKPVMSTPEEVALEAKSSEATKPGGIKKILSGKKLWLAVGVLLVIVLFLAFLAFRHASAEKTWKNATIYYEQGNYDKAAKELQGVAVPKDAARLKVYSQTMLATRQFDAALDGYRKLLAIKPEPATKLIIGNIYNEQKKPEEAIKVYRELIASDPAYVQSYANLSNIYRQRNDMPEALKVINQGIANNPDNVTLLEQRVSALRDQRNSPEFKAAVEALRQRNPNDPLLTSLGM